MADKIVNTATSLKILRQPYTKQVFNTAIPRNVDIRDAHFARKYIFSFNSSAKAAHAYNKLIDELFPGL
jgi:cellulose biosynthesis protein BcsQ